jgi:hypothetical protein
MIERLRDSRRIDGLDVGQHYLNYDGSPAAVKSQRPHVRDENVVLFVGLLT